MKYLLLIPLLLLSGSRLPAQENIAPSSTSALIIFDASGSMWGQVDGKAKIEIAREVVAKLVSSLPADTQLGLMAYGHREKGDCEDIELLIPVGKVDPSTFIAAVEEIMPKGKTPITASMEMAAETMRYTEEKATVILVSDGLETCDADPCAAAEKLEKLGVNFTAHVIAFDLEPGETKKLECIADSTGGKFLPASDADSLTDAMEIAIDASAPEPEEKEEPIPDPAVTLTVPETAVAGSEIEVSWVAETQNKNDYITFIKPDGEEYRDVRYAYAKDLDSTKLSTPITIGKAEVVYISGTTRNILARAPITLTEFEISLEAPAEAVAGSAVEIEWTGPNYGGDFITIVPKATEDGKYKKYAYTESKSPLKVIAPLETGQAEIRYMSGRGGETLARRDINLTEATIALKAPTEATMGNTVRVEWTGPNNPGDYITIVTKDTEDGNYAKYAYTNMGTPVEIIAPPVAGDAEIRYMSEQDNKVLARTDIKLTEAVITLKAAAKGIAGESIAIEWTGPNNEGDYITIVSKDAEDGKYEEYAYTEKGSPVKVDARVEPGPAEIRYMTGQGDKVLARVPIEIIATEE